MALEYDKRLRSAIQLDANRVFGKDNHAAYQQFLKEHYDLDNSEAASLIQLTQIHRDLQHCLGQMQATQSFHSQWAVLAKKVDESKDFIQRTFEIEALHLKYGF